METPQKTDIRRNASPINNLSKCHLSCVLVLRSFQGEPTHSAVLAGA